MKKDLEIIENLKNGDQKKRIFYLKTLKERLDKEKLVATTDKLEEFLNMAIDTYQEKTQIPFLMYLVAISKKELKQSDTPKNDIFYEQEMDILNLYASSVDISSEEIAKALNINIITVTQTIQKLKNVFDKNPNDVQEILPNIEKKLYPNEINSKKIITRKRPIISKSEILMIGLYTGQIEDICIDLEELAKKYGTTKKLIEFNLKNAIRKLDYQENYDALLERFPEIEALLYIRVKLLDIKIPSTIKAIKKIKKTKTQKKVNYEQMNYCRSAKLIQEIVIPKKDGNYKTNQEIANSLRLNKKYVQCRRPILLKKLENNKKFKEGIQQIYPTVLDDVKKYQDAILKKELEEDAKLLKEIYTRQEDGSFLSPVKVYKKFRSNTKHAAEKVEQFFKKVKDTVYLEKLRQIYPTILEDMEIYEKYKPFSERECKYIKISKIEQDITTKILSQQELAKKSGMTLSNIYSTRFAINKKFIEQPEIRVLNKDLYEGFIISQSHNPKRSISINEDALRTLNEQKPEDKKSKENLIKGIRCLEHSIFKNFIVNCSDTEKAMLALRFGYFNQTSFSSKDIAEFFNTSEEFVKELTTKCINSIETQKAKSLKKVKS